jgi:uncharacterized protein
MSYVPPSPPAFPPPYATGPLVTYVYEPSQEERTFGTLAHALQMAGWWIAPLVIFLSKKQQSRFVAFHALQALLLQIVFLVFWVVFMVGWFAMMFSTFANMRPGSPPPELPPQFLLFMPVAWLLGMGIWVVLLLATILYSIKAGRGEWACYPLLGRLAARMLHIDLFTRYQPPVAPQYPPQFPPQQTPPSY